jgi:hypothetical protein
LRESGSLPKLSQSFRKRWHGYAFLHTLSIPFFCPAGLNSSKPVSEFSRKWIMLIHARKIAQEMQNRSPIQAKIDSAEPENHTIMLVEGKKVRFREPRDSYL